MDSRLSVYIHGPASGGRVQLVRSLFVGAAASLVDVAVVALCFEWIGMTDMQSTAAGFTAGLIVNFILTRVWVFTGSRLSGAAEFLTFALIGVLGLGLTQLIVWVFTGPIAEAAPLGGLLSPERYLYPGKAAAIVVVFFWNFLLRKFLVYRK